MRVIRSLVPLLIFAGVCYSQNSAPQADPYKTDVDKQKMVELTGFKVSGSRLPQQSLIRLSGLRVGQMVNYEILKAACAKITATGLVSAIDYAYNVDPGKPGVMVSFMVSDEGPLYPAKIEPPDQADRVWSCLQSADPIFTREMPNTNAAILFYCANIDKCLENAGLHVGHSTATVACDLNGKASEIVFNTHAGSQPTAQSSSIKKRTPQAQAQAPPPHNSSQKDSGAPAAP